MAAAGMTAILGYAGDIEVIGRCADGDEVASAVRELRPDVVLCDVRMPRMDGVAVVRAMAGTGPEFLMMTAFDDEGVVLQAIEAGASGFMMKDDAPANIIAAVRSVAAGDAQFSPRVAKQLVLWVRDDASAAARVTARERMAALTPRETDLAIAVANGQYDAEIATSLFIAESTVKSTLKLIRQKWGVRSRTDIAVTVIRAGAA